MKIADKGESVQNVNDLLDTIEQITAIAYFEETYNYLEVLQYPAMVRDYKPEMMAAAIGKTVQECYRCMLSPRMAALVTYGHTWTYVVMPDVQKLAQKHGIN